MKIRFGIMMRLFFWYFVLATIFCATTVLLFVHIRQIVNVSENIVNVKYRVSSASKKMIETLLWMEENENKYDLLKKDDYKEYFLAGQKEYRDNLSQILRLHPPDKDVASPWKELYEAYLAQLPPAQESPIDEEPAKTLWIPEEVINDWIQKISKARSANEDEIESAMLGLNDRGRMAVRWGVVGLGFSILMGLAGSIFLAHSMNRPLRELRKGIGSISQRGLSEPIRVLTKDEFGELAGAFNEMAVMLKEEERMRSDFISMLSHEIRTPLTSIRESVNLIIEEVMGPINDRQRKFLEIASREIERICSLLNHLLQVSRLEAGALKMNLSPIDPAAFVSGTIYRLVPAAEAKGIMIETRLSRVIPHVMGDFEHLQQVLLNLLGNAIKFSPPGSKVVVRVELGPAEGGRKVRFLVSDSGPGIPQEEQALVFNKYYRATGVRDKEDGVGLGLNISRHIVEAHGGAVWVESRFGEGSTFGFALPAVEKD
jgi:signal transduction histidine kinase